MGASYSGLDNDSSSSSCLSKLALGDLPEACVALIIENLDPVEICGSSKLNRAFRGASWADFVWESKLPPNYRALLEKILGGFPENLQKRDIYACLSRINSFDEGTKVRLFTHTHTHIPLSVFFSFQKVWIDKRSAGVCLSISAKGLSITGIDDRRYWSHIPTDESRFSSVAYLQQTWWFEVNGEIDFPFPVGTYSIFFRLQLGQSGKWFGRRICNTEQVHGWDIKPVRFQLWTEDGQHSSSQCMLTDRGNWNHYHAGDFVVRESKSSSTKIKFSMTQIDCTHTKENQTNNSAEEMMTLMVLSRPITLNSKIALRLVQPHVLETGTLRTDLLCSFFGFLSCCEREFSGIIDSKLCFRERLRNGIVDIKEGDAIALFQEMIGSRPLPTLIDFSKLFSGIARTRQYDLVLDLCKKMESSGIAHNIYTLNIMINCFCRSRRTCYAYSILGKIVKLGYEPDTTTFNTLINGLCLEGKVSEGVVLIDRMVINGCEPDLVTFGSIVNGICKSGDTSLALDLLRKMEERDMKGDVVTYSTIIDSLCRDGCMDAAIDLFNEMETKGIKSSVVTYNSLIGGFCKAGKWNDGAQMLKDMISRRIIPNVVTFNVLIDAYVKEGKVHKAKEFYEEMITRGVSPDTITYNSLIDGFCMQNRLVEANKMWDLMVRNDCNPDIITFNSLLKGYCMVKKVDDAMKLFREISERGLVANTVTYSILVQGFCQSGKLKIAEELFQEMVSRGVLPDLMTYGILLDGLCDNGKLEKALEIFEDLQKRKMVLDIVMYTIIIEGMCKSGKVDDAWSLFCTLPSKGVKPNVKTYTVMISGLCKKGSLSEADAMLRRMEEDGNAPNDCTYNTMIRAHLRDGDLAATAKLIEEMKSRGFSADVSSIKMVVDLLSSGVLDKSFLDMLS